MHYVLYGIAAFMAFGVFGTIAAVGRERKPLTGPIASVMVAVASFEIVVIVLAAIRLGS